MKFKLLRLIIMTFKYSTYVFMLQVILIVNTMALESNAQYKSVRKVKIDVEFNNTSISKVFEKIQDKTEFKFYYNKADIKGSSRIYMSPGNYAISEILLNVSERAGLKFKQVNNNIAVSKIHKATNIEAERLEVIVEDVTVQGKVTDEKGEPLPGATITVKGSEKGSVTDIDGNYKLTVSENATLIYSFIGYGSAEIDVNGRATIDVQLFVDLRTLQEVVVTGYTETRWEQSSAATTKIKEKSLSRQVTTNLDDKLEGLAPGLTLNTVTPDGGQARLELVLRGVSTFDEQSGTTNPTIAARNGLNRQPLIVVDGFPYEGPFNDIDAETIASIDVLRDAAATTLWGARASNGVLVITTKRGKAGKPQISFSSNTTFGTKQNLTDFGLASSDEVIRILNRNQELEPTGFGNNVNRVVNGFSPGARYTRVNAFENIWIRYRSGDIDDAQKDAELAALGQISVLDDFEQNLLRGGLITQNSLSVNGGTENTLYSATATYTNQQSPSVGDEFKRLNLSLTTDIALSNKLSVILDASVANTTKEDNAIGVSRLYTGQNPIWPFMQLADNAGNPIPITDVYSANKDQFLTDGFDDISYNPQVDQKLLENKTVGFNLRLAGGFKYQITDWLSADMKYQHNRISSILTNHKPVDQWSRRRENNSYIDGVDVGNGVSRAVPYGGSLERGTLLMVNNVFRGSFRFKKTFAENHSISALSGMEFSESGITNNKQQFEGYDDRTGNYDVTFDPTQFGRFGTIPGSVLWGSLTNRNLFRPEVINRAVSTFGNIQYSYRDRYNLELSGKIDQHSTVGLNERLRRPLLWALGLSWNIANENFFNLGWVNQLKLRYSYGKNGNLRRGLTTITTIAFRSSDFVTSQPYASIDSPGNPNLAFETTITNNIGIDFRVFDRISGTIDLYDKNSTNLLTVKDVNSSLGLNQGANKVFTNNGEISNKGFELSLGADILSKTDFNWNVNFNYAYNKNRVIKYGFTPIQSGQSYRFAVGRGEVRPIGHPVSVIARYQWAGLDANGDPQVYNDSGELVGWNTPDDLWPTSDGMFISGPLNPPHTGALTSILSYKNLSVSFMVNFKAGHVFQETLRNKYPYTGGNFSHGFHEDIADAWENPGDEANTNIPAIPRTAGNFFVPGETAYNRRELFEGSSYGIHSASHIRMRDITLNYTLDRAANAIGMETIVFTFQMRNLGLLWTANDKGIDPESVPFSGREITFNDNFPQAYRPGISVPTSYVMGVKANF